MNNAKTAPPRFWTKTRLAAMTLPLIASVLGVIATPTEAATGATLNHGGTGASQRLEGQPQHVELNEAA